LLGKRFDTSDLLSNFSRFVKKSGKIYEISSLSAVMAPEHSFVTKVRIF